MKEIGEAMPNLKKVEIVKEITDKFSRAKSVFFTNYKGMTVQDVNDLRKELYIAKIEYKIAKKTLIRIAAKEAGYPPIDRLMEGQVGMAFSYDDPAAPGKIITTYIKKNKSEKFSITGCIFEGVAFGAEHVEAIIELPSRKELIGNFIGTLSAPMSNLIGILSTMMSQLVTMLNSLSGRKKE